MRRRLRRRCGRVPRRRRKCSKADQFRLMRFRTTSPASTSVSPFRGARSGAIARVLHSWNARPGGPPPLDHRLWRYDKDFIGLRRPREANARRSPQGRGRADAPRRLRARPAAAKGHRRDRPPFARQGSAPWTRSGPRACAERRNSPPAPASKNTTASQASAPFFVAPKGENVDPGPPRHVGRRRLGRNERIGEARAVHMHADPVAVSDRAELRNFAHAIDRPRFGSLGQRQRARLRRTSPARAEISPMSPASPRA